jgi:phosphopantetheinyl transferase (holo-ACP synthase)
VDVVKVERLVQSLERFGHRMEARLYTEAELEYCRRHKDPLPHGRGMNQLMAFRFVGPDTSRPAGAIHSP